MVISGWASDGFDTVGKAQIVGVGGSRTPVGGKQIEHFGEAQPVFMDSGGSWQGTASDRAGGKRVAPPGAG
jgi:hypothetical protein